ncbi:MAG: LytTR family DNA-binding domain-containing protein [Acetobacter sp.]|nr:LytTR family DNA-binding domain-containing protein [Bacteroides sp.]MCM1340959.1 LytTR family DNA-binding domain-containing protein [Acetobacter sp.]MCM1432485.1 LytTR family DNA-binding domain-containing protein [Clostridiales bacterium]
MKILICDDEEEQLKELKLRIEEYMKNHYIKADFVTATSPSEILKSDDAFDFAFLDIQMPEIDGITLAKELKNRNEKVILFFITAFDEYQDEAMDLHIFRFFDKPLDVDRLYSSLDRAIEYLDESYIEIYIENDSRHIKLPVDEIKYIKRENRKNTVFTNNGNYVVRCSFDELISKLPNTFFYLVHKSFYVNLHYITEYGYKEIFIDDTRISIATRKQADFHKYWFNYVKRR